MKIRNIHTVVLGSGASGLCAAVRLNAEGVDDVAIVTEGLDKGVSINTGSDKQTYYKLGLCGATPDSPRALAETYLSAGGTDGDLALVEASTSTRAFFHLVDLGVPFPCDAYGQYAGYKTDHDPAKRATSCGPYTSREMCRALIQDVKRRKVDVYEGETVVKLLTRDIDVRNGVPYKRIVGLISITSDGEPIVYHVKNVVFAVGGPGGLYKTSVYPEVHTGAIGLALEVGAITKGLSESQFGLASFTDVTSRSIRVKNVSRPKEFRWNVSGTFMQVVPKFVSTDCDGSNEREFLWDYFDEPGDLFGRVFLKGYQWPFDARKAIDGSSFIDLCVFYETAICKRRVFLDYRENPARFSFDALPDEAREYLTKSGALLESPFERLYKMNPGSIELYRDWGIDLATEPLEIGVCAQHNNGGLDVDVWWRSTNIEGLYPIGEVAGTHGVARPGGSALNAGQVGAFRAAQRIAREYVGGRRVGERSLKESVDSRAESFKDINAYVGAVAELIALTASSTSRGVDWRAEREELRTRMSECAGVFRSSVNLSRAVSEAREQYRRLTRLEKRDGLIFDDDFRFDLDAIETLRNVQLCVAQIAYLDSVYAVVLSKVGSRGSSLATSSDGTVISTKFPEDWRIQDEDANFRDKAFCSYFSNLDDEIVTESFWRSVRPIPEPDEWFENVWRDYRDGKIFE
ncbi:MAG: FAD-binding protein [Thermoguttaceae bacterium]|nr:FAD-binding protein [Thermoguttaceae bacterium]